MNDPYADASAQAILTVTDLNKYFGAVAAARDVNLSFRRDETVGIIGSNGAGKTTFVNMVTGYLKPTTGKIRYLDRNITGLPPREITRAGLSRSFQIPQLFGEMTVRENVTMGLAIAEAHALPMFNFFRSSARDDAVAEVLHNYQIADIADDPVDQLPQGHRKLVDVAMATVSRPDLLLLDEPTSGITTAEKFSLMDVIMEVLARRGVTVLFIEHDMDIISRYADRVIAFYAGSIIADGPPNDVLEDAQVREFVIGAHLERRALATSGTGGANAAS